MTTELSETFDPSAQEGTEFNLLPVGEYTAQITDISISEPRSGNGQMINITWQVVAGEHTGRYVWQRITFIHTSVQAQAIGRRTLTDLCRATGVTDHVRDVDVFKFKPVLIRVGIESDKNAQYPDKNKVLRIRSINEAPKAAPSATTTNPKPWNRTSGHNHDHASALSAGGARSG